MSLLDEFVSHLSFELDDFQLQGCRSVQDERSVLVCAPTGAGKTIVGEFAAAVALRQGTRCFYTTPIKALSNQKFHDLVTDHGEDAVGLLTGDVSINPSAPIVVMTTEVLRNMIYASSGSLDRLTHVVMDEIHFLADRDRGAVWEEVILGLEDHVQLIGLSATVSNSEEFGEWLRTVRGDTDIVVSDHRPIPLDQHMMVGRRVYELFEPGSDRVNGQLLSKIERVERAEDRFRPLGRPEVISVLRDRDMLPAITFIFSRAGCDGALFQCLRSQLVLTTSEESALIKELVDDAVADIDPEDLQVLRFTQWRAALMRGFAAHHAGMLPAFRHIVERLFVRGLLKAVFATETLALGINMPARTVVLEKLVKFNGETHADLTPGQYTQLTGRAGRRGIDHMGNAVVQWAPALDPRAVAGLASTRTYPLVSTFAPGYNMAINMVKMNGREESLRLIEKSFAQFQADASVVGDVRAIEKESQVVDSLEDALDNRIRELAVPGGRADIVDYVQLRQRLSREEREAKQRASTERKKEVVAVLGKLQVGDVIALAGPKRPQLAAVVTPASQPHDPRPWITTEKGWSGRIDASGIAIPPITIGRIRVPKNVRNHPRRNTRMITAELRRGHFERPKSMKARSRVSSKIKNQIREHPVHAWPVSDREELARLALEYSQAKSTLDARKATVSRAKDTLGSHFDRILGLLSEMDYVEVEAGEYQVTEEGERLARIHAGSDLLIAQCLKRGVWDNLDPAELAGAVSTCVFENRKALAEGEVDVPTDAMAAAITHTQRVWGELASDERRHRLPLSREPDPAFATAAHQWAAGAPLGYCLQAAAHGGAELTPGDFVRSCLQLNDALEQVAKTAYTDEVRRNARKAIGAISRGVVAVSA
ncbi:DEAD/DEAH box helicase [Corynebacterium tapiri]|uniref:DEAD/DEAH box helicase n=1 Tax=Corynebacterium tapiri TaxID=1448266 RepID=A0A5C4U3K6_9CORY|nr:DEAD/DEAH box helicase [Corynebacterium tapiri]TNL97617.1 DEAD/DEAH box helicase [Corynebacterium tapiri]